MAAALAAGGLFAWVNPPGAGASTGDISTVAGDPQVSATPQVATSVSQGALGVAVSLAKVYTVDEKFNVVRVYDPSTGDSAVVVGTGTACTSSTGTCGDNGQAGSAELNEPHAIAFDSAGDLFIADGSDNRVREVMASSGAISPTSTIKTVVGTGTACADPVGSPPAPACGDTGTAGSAQLNYPSGLAFDTSGNLYISDSNDNRIRKVTASGGAVSASGTITTVAGTGGTCPGGAAPGGACGDGGLATAAQLNSPTGLAVNGAGDLYISDTEDNRVRKVDHTSGDISAFAGTGDVCSANGNPCGDTFAATSAYFTVPTGLAVDGSGNVFIADTGGDQYGNDTGDNRVREVVAATGNIVAFAGTGTACPSRTATCGDGGAADAAPLTQPTGLAFDASGNLYVSDSYDDRLRRVAATANVVSPSSTISTVAGNGNSINCGDGTSQCGDNGPARSAVLHNPWGVAADKAGNVFVSDTFDNRIRRIDATTGVITNVAGTGASCVPVTALCGDGGPASQSQMSQPEGLAFDPAGDLFIADGSDNRVREVVAQGGTISAADTIITVAGTGNWCSASTSACGDGGQASAADLAFPVGLAFDSAGDLFISDTTDNRVREVVAQGGAVAPTDTIQAVVGSGTACSTSTDPCGDGGDADQAQMNLPEGMAFDSAGDLFIVDSVDNRVREVAAPISPTSKMSTILGSGTTCADFTTSCGDGTGAALTAQLASPVAVAFDGAGNMYVADWSQKIRKLAASGGKVAPTGDVSSVAGTGAVCPETPAPCGDGGPASAASFNGPTALAFDSSGDLYITESEDSRLRKVDSLGSFPNNAPAPPANGGGGGGFSAPTTTTTTTPPGSVVATDLSGPDSIGTSVAASQDLWASWQPSIRGAARPRQLSAPASTAVISRVDDYADGLVGTPLAAAKRGPLLLTGTTSLDQRVLAEVKRILPPGATVYLLGGPSALSPQVEAAITAAGYQAVRLGGANRYATAVDVANAIGKAAVVLEASGIDFADALPAGAAASHAGGVVLLTAGTVPASETLGYLAAHPGIPRVAVGGPAAQADPTAVRIVGADRYTTAVDVAEAFFQNPSAVGVATGVRFDDGLVGGAHVSEEGGALLLTDPAVLPAPVKSYLGSLQAARPHLIVYGGPAAVAPAVVSALGAALG